MAAAGPAGTRERRLTLVALAALAVVVRREERVRPGRTFLRGMAPPAQPPAAGVAAAGSMSITGNASLRSGGDFTASAGGNGGAGNGSGGGGGGGAGAAQLALTGSASNEVSSGDQRIGGAGGAGGSSATGVGGSGGTGGFGALFAAGGTGDVRLGALLSGGAGGAGGVGGAGNGANGAGGAGVVGQDITTLTMARSGVD